MLGEQLRTLAGYISQAFPPTSATCSVTILSSLKSTASFCLIRRVSSLMLNLAALLQEERFDALLGQVALGSLREANAFSRVVDTCTFKRCCCVPYRAALFCTTRTSGALAVQLTQPSGIEQLEQLLQKV